MQIRYSLLLFLLLPCYFTGYTQKLKKAEKQVLVNLQHHIRFLASDRLEGRRAGTKGERLAADYISNQFKRLGLEPKGDSGYLQPFSIYDGKQVNSSSFLIINGYDLVLNRDYFPLAMSPNKTAEAAVSMALAESGVPWFTDLREMLEPNKNNPHFDLESAIREKALAASDKGATALILYNNSDFDDKLSFDGKERTEPVPIPVLYVTREAVKKYLNDPSAVIDLKLKVDIGDKTRTGHNVVAFINNGAASTIVLGAHYDHLGYGEDGNSMLRTDEHLVHNGADDNASGTASLIELAGMLKSAKRKNYNFLFVAFSAEELGLNGSKFFTDHPAIALNQVDYMINMDMIGRLNDSTHTLTIGGYGTSPAWGSIFGQLKKMRDLQVHFDSSGTGPSDHTSFYRKDIPVLFFFTGLHGDYHRPSDDYDKINYTGEVLVLRLINDLIKETEEQPRLAFSKTRESSMSSSSVKLKGVTMGIMPDYTFNGAGIRIDAVSEGRPAQAAGLKAGDIIIQLGELTTGSMEDYMKALNQLKKGDKTKVRYKRGEDILESDVQF